MSAEDRAGAMEHVPMEQLAKWTVQGVGSDCGWVYGLTDPTRDGAVAYVGQTVNIILRYCQHCDPNHSKADVRRAWVANLKATQMSPGLVVLERPLHGDLFSAESWWTIRLQRLGFAWLNRGELEPGQPIGGEALKRAMELDHPVARTPEARRRAKEERQLLIRERDEQNKRQSWATRDERERAIRDARTAAVAREVERAARIERKQEKEMHELRARTTEAEFERRVMEKAKDLLEGIERRYRNTALIGAGPELPSRLQVLR